MYLTLAAARLSVSLGTEVDALMYIPLKAETLLAKTSAGLCVMPPAIHRNHPAHNSLLALSSAHVRYKFKTKQPDPFGVRLS